MAFGCVEKHFSFYKTIILFVYFPKAGHYAILETPGML